MSNRLLRITLGLALACSLVSALAASAETRQVVAGKQYDRGGSWRFWFGEGYRKAWATPVELPVLDLATEAGGLKPLKEIGGLQSVGLAMAGADGRGYTFRKLEKQTERILPPEWRDSAPAAIVRDQTAAAHPAATIVVGALARSVGIRFYRSRLMIMPDDPALGEFRKTFAGSVGTLDEYITPGYDGITEIVSSTDLWKRWLAGGPENRVDSRAFLKARLFDVVTGNWDRHQGQWRWAHLPGQAEWEPLPEDADQCFTRYQGVVMGYAHLVTPRFMSYSGKYPGHVDGLTDNNADVTRWIPTDLDWPAYQAAARELKQQLTDAVIDEAMHQMPPEWYAIDGAMITQELRQRRDGLEAFLRKFYLHLSDRVDVRATDRDETATLVRGRDGDLDVTIAPRNPDGSLGAPSFHRRFLRDETKEVRVYMFGGDDRVETSGPRGGAIKLRVLGGAGNDVLDDTKSGGTDLRDSDGRNTFRRGSGTSVKEDPWTNPWPRKDAPWLEPRNFGSWRVPTVMAWWEPDQAFMLGGGFTRTGWGFRDYPWASLQSFTLLYSTGYNKFRTSYTGQFRLNESRWVGGLELFASGIENLHYFGFGNETAFVEDQLSETQDYTFWFYPSLRWQPSRRFEFHLGGEVKAVEPINGGGTLVEQEKPYGAGRFGEVGVRTGIEVDTRGRSIGLSAQGALLNPTGQPMLPKVSGVRILAEGFFVPKAWDVTSNFGGVDGSVAGYLGNQKLSFAARTGGRVLWGTYPWFESASIGGSDNVRGYDSNRFRGDSSLYGNAELRYWLGKRKTPILPLRWGLFGFGETGRVWLEGEDSKRWHTGYGLGLMTQLIGIPMTAAGSIANSDEGLKFYFTFGYSF